jgi:hypothetical protein
VHSKNGPALPLPTSVGANYSNTGASYYVILVMWLIAGKSLICGLVTDTRAIRGDRSGSTPRVTGRFVVDLLERSVTNNRAMTISFEAVTSIAIAV